MSLILPPNTHLMFGRLKNVTTAERRFKHKMKVTRRGSRDPPPRHFMAAVQSVG